MPTATRLRRKRAGRRQTAHSVAWCSLPLPMERAGARYPLFVTLTPDASLTSPYLPQVSTSTGGRPDHVAGPRSHSWRQDCTSSNAFSPGRQECRNSNSRRGACFRGPLETRSRDFTSKVTISPLRLTIISASCRFRVRVVLGPLNCQKFPLSETFRLRTRPTSQRKSSAPLAMKRPVTQ